MFLNMTQSAFNIAAAIVFILAVTAIQLICPVLFGTLTAAQIFTFSRIRRALLRSLIILPVYIAVGVIVTHIKPLTVSETSPEDFNTDNYYGTKNMIQRAAIIDDNKEALVQRLRLIANAKSSIVMSTYDIRDDSSGRAMASFLKEAADRGVKVRLLVDGFSSFSHSEKSDILKTLASHENVDFKVFSPINILRPWAIMSRMHEKYIIADDSVMLAGGRNTHNGFLGKYPSKGGNIDLDVMVWDVSGTGAIKDELDHFDEIFSLKCSKAHPFIKPDTEAAVKSNTFMDKKAVEIRKDHPEIFEPYDYSQRTVPVRSLRLVRNSMNPGPKEPFLWYTLVQLMNDAKETVNIHTPYLICGKRMYADLEYAVSGGADFKLTLNSPKTGANLFGAGVYLNEKKHISDMGLAIYEYMGSPSSHTKAIRIDDSMSVVGSFNMDMRSAYMNNEQMVVADSPELAAQLDKYMEYVQSQSLKAADAENYPSEDPPIRKLLVDVMRIFERPLRFLL